MSYGYCKSVCYGESRQTEDSGRKQPSRPEEIPGDPDEMIRGADGKLRRQRTRRRLFTGVIPLSQIQNLRALCAHQKVPIRQLAQRFGLGVSYCHRLIKGKSRMLA